MNSFKGDLGGIYTFDKIVEIENLGFCYLVYVTALTLEIDEHGFLVNKHFDGVRSIQIGKHVDTEITYNDIIYNWENIGKLIMLIENEHLKKALDSL